MEQFKSRKAFNSDIDYGGYVKSKLRVEMTVICSNAYEDIKAGDIGKVIKMDGFDIMELNVHCDWLDKKGSYWVRFSDIQILGFLRSDNIKLGDWVRVRYDVSDPKYQWGNIHRKSVGIVTAISSNREQFTADFPDQENWKGYLPDMEKIPPLHPSIMCDGCKLFPISGARFKCSECANLNYCNRCFRSQSHNHDFNKLEICGARQIPAGKSGSPVVVGDYVRVKSSVTQPRYDWGNITDRRSIGKVTNVKGDTILADFSDQIEWKGLMSDIEIVPIVHVSHRCHGCRLNPIGGDLYICQVCDDFTYCGDCFMSKSDHKHEFSKTRVPGGTKQVRQPAGMPPKATGVIEGGAITPTSEFLPDLFWWNLIIDDGESGRKKPDMPASPAPQVYPGGQRIPVNEGGPTVCSYFSICKRFLQTLGLSGAYFDYSFDQCFCDNCHERKNDRPYFTRGVPPKKYGLPIGWAKFGLRPPANAQALDIFKNWHMAFHGTLSNCIKPILETGSLLLPGDVTPAGVRLSIPENHWDPSNPKMLPPEGHNVQEVYLSPSIKYSGCDVYAPTTRFDDTLTGKTYECRVAFQCRIKPGRYKVGDQTIGRASQIDDLFENKELEWSTEARGVIIMTGILVKVEGAQPGGGSRGRRDPQPKGK